MFEDKDPLDPMVALHILVVDSNPEELDYTMAIVAESGHIADKASTGSQAIELAYKVPYDLILMEMNLSELNGLETTRIIRALPESRGSLPIIALTSTSNPEHVKQCFEVGMTNFLLKPLTKGSLNSAVAAYAYKKRKYALASGNK